LANARNASPAKSNQKVFAPPLGASPRLDMLERRPSWLTGPADQDQKPLFCRSRLASEKPEGAALNQAANVIVNDLREQARSYKPLKPAGRPLCSWSAFDLDLRRPA